MQKHFLSGNKMGGAAANITSESHRAQLPHDFSRKGSLRDLEKNQGLKSLRGPLFYRSLEGDNDVSPTNSGRSPKTNSPRANGISPLSTSSGRRDSILLRATDVCFFRIELLDPQINFLDSKCGGSMICSTGVIVLEGWYHTAATLSSAAGASNDPKRRYEIRLR